MGFIFWGYLGGPWGWFFQVPPNVDSTSALELYVKNQNTSALVFYFTYNSSALVGSEFGGTWEDSGDVFF